MALEVGGQMAVSADPGHNEGEQPARLARHGAGTVAVLHVGRVNDGAQQHAKRVDQDMPLAAGDLLARVLEQFRDQ